MNDVILSVQDLHKTFMVDRRSIKAVDGISFDVCRGECFAIVGESGSGKSTVANMILGLYPPTAGKLVFNNAELTMQRDKFLRRGIQLVQQNPLSSLNSRRSIEKSLRLALDVHEQKKLLRKVFRFNVQPVVCLLYTSPSPRDQRGSRMPSSA